MSTNMYLKFEEPAITGEAGGDHAGEIEVLSWSHGFAQPTSPTRSAAGSGTEQATHRNLTFTKYLDSSTNELLKHCWSGNQFGKVTLKCFRSDGATDAVEYLRVTMQEVIISNYAVSGGPGDMPVENVSLDYGIVHYKYGDPKQALTVTHDVTKHVVQ